MKRSVDWVVCVLLAVASLAMALWHVPQHTTVSPIDEYVYIDYLAKVPDQLVVHRGEETGEYARQFLSCNGVRAVGHYPDAMCAHPSESQEPRLPNGGVTTADLYTPLYFGATWLMAQPLLLLGVDDLTEAGRYTGWVWLAAGSIVLYLALRRWRVPVVAAGGAGLIMVGSLAAYWSNTYISTDATVLFASSLLIFGATMLDRPSRRTVSLFVVFAVLASLLKLQNLMAVGSVSLFLLILAAVGATRAGDGLRSRLALFSRDKRVWAAVIGAGAALAAQGVWVAIRSAIAVGPLPDQDVSAPFGKTAFIREALAFLPGVSAGALDPTLLGIGAVLSSAIVAWVITGGTVGLALSSGLGTKGEALAISALVIAVAAGPLLAITNILVGGYYFQLPARYGMPLIPIFLTCAALLVAQKKWAGYLLLAAGAVSYS
ncbi:MAG: hypothetical protein JWQ68_2362, partial [Cryobacterium sp.]|nr:hypothetical protein [Cryobacterium sp.]